MHKEHHFKLTTEWTGNTGKGTQHYTSYERSYSVIIPGKPELKGSSVPQFQGDATRHNPEDLLLASLSSCHMLWYLHLCTEAKVVVTAYSDRATGIMVEIDGGSGHFIEATLHPEVQVTESWMIDKANELHAVANKFCFIANSVNFPVKHQPVCTRRKM